MTRLLLILVYLQILSIKMWGNFSACKVKKWLDDIWLNRQHYKYFITNIKKINNIVLNYTNSYDIMWRAAKCNYYYGTYLIHEKEKRLNIYELGIKCGRYAIKRNLKKAEGIYWLSVLYGEYADTISPFRALKYVYKMKWGLEKTLKIDDKYEDGMAYLILGALYLQYPGWPLGFGDIKIAFQYLSKAYKLNPQCKAVYEYLALYYYKYKNNKKKALDLLNKALSLPIDECCIIEEKTILKEVRELKNKIEND